MGRIEENLFFILCRKPPFFFGFFPHLLKNHMVAAKANDLQNTQQRNCEIRGLQCQQYSDFRKENKQ